MAPSLSKAMGSPKTHPSPYRNTPRGAVQFTTPFPLQQAHPRDHSRKRHNHRRNTRPQHTTHQGDPHEQQPRYQHVNRQRQRQRWKAQALPCAICGQAIDYTLKAPHPYSFVIDEIIPLKHGGTLTYDNQEPAHWWCNRIKSTHSLTWARRKVHELIQQGNAPQHDHNHTTTPIAPSHWFD